MRIKNIFILLPVLMMVLCACVEGEADQSLGINPVKAAGLDATTRVDVFDTHADGAVPVLQLDDSEAIAGLIEALDATFRVTPKTFCEPRYTLHFNLEDGSTFELSYFCDSTTPFIRSDAEVFRNEDFAVSDEFVSLMFNMLIQDHAESVIVSEDTEYTPGSELANPASVFCEEQGGSVDMRTDDSGGQYGTCIFDDGSSCEEWAYFRGECKPGQ